MQDIVLIENKIHTIRGKQVMLDRDLAVLYGVSVKALNQAVKRNIERFPDNFMFQLVEEELVSLRIQGTVLDPNKVSQFVMPNLKSQTVTSNLRSQNVTIKGGRGKHIKYLPHVFTEQGVSMLSGVLRSETAVKVSIQIMNAFVSMRKFISSNADVFRRLDNVERRNIEYDSKLEKIFDLIESREVLPSKGIFFDGQVFDAHKFVSDLIKSASSSIILIDNYIDSNVLDLFSASGLNVKIYTKDISSKLELTIVKFNTQYGGLEVFEFAKTHDRFMIIDSKTVYHFGASLKDLGKKWFAFSKFDKEAVDILKRL